MNKRSFFRKLSSAALIVLSLIFFSFSKPATGIYSRAAAQQTDIAKRLHDLADKKLRSAKVTMPADAKASVNELIDQGADALTKESATEAQIKTAEDNLGKFIDNLIANGEGLRGKAIRVNDKTVKKAKKSLCPLFPFC